jgi:hypothetical protein
MNNDDKVDDMKDDCIVHTHAVPPSLLGRYSVDRDPHSEQDIARYVEIEAHDETIQHVERIKEEIVLSDYYEIWEVTTDKDRWWVITNLTNLYSQKHFPSLDYTLSFHIGLMMRLRSRPGGADSEDPTPFDEVFRRQEQAKSRLDGAVEAEDFQAVGMQLRECLLSLIAAIRRRVELKSELERPQDANFIAWSAVLMDQLCGGGCNKDLRHYLKNTAKDTWQLVNWLTHDRNANETACSIAIHACDSVVGHFVQILVRERTDSTKECPLCKSRNIRTHFDRSIEPDGDYYMTCGVCDWNNHPGEANLEEPSEGSD